MSDLHFLRACENLNVGVHTCNPTLGRPGQRNSWGLQAGQPNQRGGQKKGNCLGSAYRKPSSRLGEEPVSREYGRNRYDRTLTGLCWPLRIHQNVHLHTHEHIHYTRMHTHTQKKYRKISLTHFVYFKLFTMTQNSTEVF